MMTKSECQEMLDKGRFRTNLIGKKILKSHLELYDMIGNVGMADVIQWYSEKLANVAYDCLSGKEENEYE